MCEYGSLFLIGLRLLCQEWFVYISPQLREHRLYVSVEGVVIREVVNFTLLYFVSGLIFGATYASELECIVVGEKCCKLGFGETLFLSMSGAQGRKRGYFEDVHTVFFAAPVIHRSDAELPEISGII